MVRPASAIVLLASLATAAPAQQASFTLFPSGSHASGITADGSVVVGDQFTTGIGYRAFRWAPSTGFQDIGPGYAKAISDDGSVISGFTAGGTSNAFRWTAATGTQTLGIGQTSGISRDGSVIVGAASGPIEGFRWSAATGLQSLPDLPGGGSPQIHTAYNISGDGSTIVGSVGWPAGGVAGVRWTSAGAASLGQIPGGTPDAAATALSDDGSIIYGMARGPSGYDTFRWTVQTGMVGLGVAAGGFSAPLPTDCTPDGGILVGYAFTRAFVWRLGSGPQDVQTVLEENYHLNLGNLLLLRVSGISDDGRTIVGNAQDGNLTYGWVATLPWSIPTPSTAAILIPGLFLARRRPHPRTTPACSTMGPCSPS